jgi:hypothetical protein
VEDVSNKCGKKVLLASDIFGLSNALLSLLEETTITDHVKVVTPFNQVKTQFESEQQAYQCFQKHGGIGSYVVQITEILKADTEINQVIGFSAGAAALYKVMSDIANKNIRLTLFYPRQIRYFLDKHPNSPCHIVFPKVEQNFSLSKVIKALEQQSNVKIEQNIYQHGFMNKDSSGFSQLAYQEYSQMLKALVLQN